MNKHRIAIRLAKTRDNKTDSAIQTRPAHSRASVYHGLLLALASLAMLLIAGCSAPTETAAPTVPATIVAAVTETPAPTPTATAEPTATTEPTATPEPTATAEPTATPEPTMIPTPASIDDLMAQEMRASFDFFWEQANTDPASPGFGLIRDRFPGSEGISSIASVGFGLTAYPIGVENGYISLQEGYDRANGTLDTLLALDRTEGFYFHFLDMKTGKRAWQSEVSTIDTAILMMGVLTAGEYFGGEVQDKALEIYAGVNWPWFIDESRQMFRMAYRPGEGYGGHWDFYAEQLMLYVLAAGSPTFPTDDVPYYTFKRHYAANGDEPKFIHSWFGSLFTYQYSHAWLDFRGRTDRDGVNWFDNSVLASQSQVDFAAAVDEKYETIGPDAWGLTASDGPKGYNGLYGAPPSGFDNKQHFIDDTVPPSGAIGSIIFVPEAAKRAMMNYATVEGLTGRYGFQDAYNLTEEWIAPDVIGINKGITLLMLANHQNDLVYSILMKNEHIRNGLDRLQITANE